MYKQSDNRGHSCCHHNYLDTFHAIAQNIHLDNPNTLLNLGKSYNVSNIPCHIPFHTYCCYSHVYSSPLYHMSDLYRLCYTLSCRYYHSKICFCTPCIPHLTDKKNNLWDIGNNLFHSDTIDWRNVGRSKCCSPNRIDHNLEQQHYI